MVGYDLYFFREGRKNMNKKAQITVGAILIGFIGILVALILLQGTFPFIGASTNTYTLTNSTFTAPAAGSTIDLVGQELLGTAIVINQTSGSVVPASNYTIAERVSPIDGLKRISYRSNGGVFNSVGVNISYSYGQEGYIDDAGGRGVAGLIPIMAVLAIIAVAIGLAIKKGMFD